jgi:hypothetical protein
MKKERKAMTGIMARGTIKGLFHSQSPSFRATSNKPHPNATNAMPYRE